MQGIVLCNVTLGYDRHPAVHHLDAWIAPGTLTALAGPNGAGKTTLLRALSGEVAPMEGEVRLPRGASIGYLPQQAGIDREFPIAVRDLVAMGLWRRIGALGWAGRAEAARIDAAIAAVGLTGFERRPIRSLSGGQFQRALFARLMLQEADLILLDEPFTAIDARTVADLLRVVARWHGEGRTVIAVLHDLDAVRRHFPATMLIARELIAHGGTPEVLTAENLFRARQLVEAFDPHAPVCRRSAA